MLVHLALVNIHQALKPPWPDVLDRIWTGYHGTTHALDPSIALYFAATAPGRPLVDWHLIVLWRMKAMGKL